MAYSITKEIESRVFEVDKNKVEFKGIAISLDDDGGVILGNQRVYRGRSLEDARAYYDKVKRVLRPDFLVCFFL